MGECKLCGQIESSVYIFDESKLLPEKIWECCELMISQNDGIPQQICCTCEIKLNSYTEFRQTCIKNFITLEERCNEITEDIAESKISINVYDRSDMSNSPEKYQNDDENNTLEDIKPSRISESIQLNCLSKCSSNNLMSECRLCLQIGPPIYIFDKSKSLPEKIWDCCGLKIMQSDGLPHQICLNCEMKLNSFIEFKQTCVKNYVILKERCKEITEEVVDSKILIDTYDRSDIPNSPDIYSRSIDDKCVMEDVKPFQISGTVQFHCLSNTPSKDLTLDVELKKEELQSSISPISNVIKIENNVSTLDDHASTVQRNNEPSSSFTYQGVDEKYTVVDIKFCKESEIARSDGLLSDPINNPLTNNYMECGIKKENNLKVKNEDLHSIFKNVDINQKQYNNCENISELEIIGDKHIQPIQMEKSNICHETSNKNPLPCQRIKRYNLLYSRCNLCNAECESEINFDSHIKRYHEVKWKTFECDICHKIYKWKISLRKHIERHMNLLERKHRCDKCDFKTEDKSVLVRHVESVHLKKTFECDICKKILKNNYSFRLHRKRHMNLLEKRFRCDKCDYKFEVKSGLIRHIENIHLNKTFECDMCRKIFRREHTMKQHRKRHTNQIEKKHQCDKCNYKTEFKGALILHVNSVHLNITYECDVCHKIYTSEYRMKRHRKRHLNLLEK